MSGKKKERRRPIKRRTERLSISLPPELKAEVEAAAERESRTVSNFVGLVLKDLLEREGDQASDR